MASRPPEATAELPLIDHLVGRSLLSYQESECCATRNSHARPSFSLVSLVIRLGWTLDGSPGIFG